MSLPLYKVSIAYESTDKTKISLEENQTVKILQKIVSGIYDLLFRIEIYNLVLQITELNCIFYNYISVNKKSVYIIRKM